MQAHLCKVLASEFQTRRPYRSCEKVDGPATWVEPLPNLEKSCFAQLQANIPGVEECKYSFGQMVRIIRSAVFDAM